MNRRRGTTAVKPGCKAKPFLQLLSLTITPESIFECFRPSILLLLDGRAREKWGQEVYDFKLLLLGAKHKQIDEGGRKGKSLSIPSAELRFRIPPVSGQSKCP